jgi:hypothetical protein
VIVSGETLNERREVVQATTLKLIVIRRLSTAG